MELWKMKKNPINKTEILGEGFQFLNVILKCLHIKLHIHDFFTLI